MTAPTSPTTGLLEGERRKLAAHALLEVLRNVYVRRGRRALLRRLLAAETATIDDVRAVVELPPNINPKLFGAVPGPLAEVGIIEATGYVSTTRKVGHARPVLCWRLADRGAALTWLAVHPDLLNLEPAIDQQPTPFD